MFRKRPQIATGIGFSSYRGFPAKPAQAFQCVLGKQVVYHHHLRPRCPPAPANLFTVVAGIYRGRNQPLPACEMKSRQGASNAIVAGPIILLFPVVPHFVFGRWFIGKIPVAIPQFSMAAEQLHVFPGPIALEKNKTEIVQRRSIIRPYRQDFAKTSGRILAAPQVAQEKATVERNLGISQLKRR